MSARKLPREAVRRLALRFAAGEKLVALAAEYGVSLTTTSRTVSDAVERGEAPPRGEYAPEVVRALIARLDAAAAPMNWRDAIAALRARPAAEEDPAVSRSAYTCAKCGGVFERFPDHSREAQPPTMLGGRPFCPKCAAARFRPLTVRPVARWA